MSSSILGKAQVGEGGMGAGKGGVRLGLVAGCNGWELGGRHASQDSLKSLRPRRQLRNGD